MEHVGAFAGSGAGGIIFDVVCGRSGGAGESGVELDLVDVAVEGAEVHETCSAGYAGATIVDEEVGIDCVIWYMVVSNAWYELNGLSTHRPSQMLK